MPHRRTTADNALSIAQTRRTEARLAWIDRLVDSHIAVWPDKKAELELMRIDLRESNTDYTDVLNATDDALIDRVSAIVGNETLDRVAADSELRALIDRERGT